MVETRQVPDPSVDDQPFVASSAARSLPEGSQNIPAGKPFWLKVNFTNERGQPASGYAAKVGQNAAESFWDYMCIREGAPGGSAAKFQVDGETDGWPNWKIDDGNYLSVKATGWLYRSSAYPIGWVVANGQLMNTYWGGPVGFSYRSFLVSTAYYLGMDLPVVSVEVVFAD